MRRFRRSVPVLSICLLVAWSSLARAAIVHHVVDYTFTTSVAGGHVAFDFTDGSADPGGPVPPIGMRLIPSNDGGVMEIEFLSGSGGGVIIDTGAPSFLAMRIPAGTTIDSAYGEWPAVQPGYSTEGGVGRGRVRYFGTGNLGSGEKGYVGMRFRDGGATYYGWAEVSATDSTSMTLYQVSYEDEAEVPIVAGDSGFDLIGMWEGTRASVPGGWNSVGFTNDRFVYGTDTGEDPLDTGGSLTHVHSVNPPNTRTGNDWNDQGKRNLTAGLNVADDNHKHDVNFPAQSSTPSSTLPDKVQKLVFMRGHTDTIPTGLIALWAGPSAPTGWARCDGISSNFDLSDRFIMGVADGENPHAIDNGFHTHEVTFPTVTSGPATQTIARRGAAVQQQLAHPNHTHEFFLPVVTLDSLEVLPPHTELAFIIRTGEPVPPRPGIILMWSGAVAEIPEDWVLCDGTNGTPDLRNQFVRATTSGEEPGTTGGSATHVHAVDPPPQSGGYPSSAVAQGLGTENLPGDTHVHTLDIPEFNSGSASSIPPYVKLAYVMYAPDPDPTGVDDFAAASGTSRLALHAPAPNPGIPATTIRFELGRREHVELAIYDTAGRRVRSLSSSPREAGSHQLRWDGRSDAGTSVAAGIYFARLTAAGREVTRKLAVVR
jgi:hypothetical protein